MNSNTITGISYFEARQYLGLSLSAVSKLTGINRNNLSQFEKEKATLDSRQKKALKSFYEERGYMFDAPEEPDAEIVTEQYQQAKTDLQQSLADGSETAQALSTFIDSVHDVLMTHDYFTTETERLDQLSVVDIPESPAYQQTALLLKKLFEADKTGAFHGCCGFFGESADERADKYLALLALQQLRLLKTRYPDLVELDDTKVPKQSDNARVLRQIITHLNNEDVLNHQSLPELSQVSGQIIP